MAELQPYQKVIENMISTLPEGAEIKACFGE